ncbi:60S ribosome subunit biogenesis protein NIP7 homolog [Paramacrobiotus metropolitanus]|uniref:60S ribosome subunit biogenesis protein NIP7 homolog n=1 Tax=Paramacrobiotus metropolitanus TaxID=2943436 RepID=UPI002445F818|nr:60S ribosome subunit biogenesis protein NIP7 homolog [Paramacrobiotus metropolitanus]
MVEFAQSITGEPVCVFEKKRFVCCPLTDEEARLVFEKLSKYIGSNIKRLLDRPDGLYCFRLHNDRIFYARESLVKQASVISRDNLASFGTCFGKMTKTGKFRLHITALDFLAPYAQFRVLLKPNAEQQFLYGHNIAISGIHRISDNTPKYAGIVVFSAAETPLGFGVAAKSSAEIKHADPIATGIFHQADLGEYIRQENTLI